MGPQYGGDSGSIPCRLFRILSSKLTTLSRRGKIAAGDGCRSGYRASWQIAAEPLSDGLRPEDGTDFSSHAAGASPVIARNDRSPVVVGGNADHARARADRSQCEAAMRFLRAVP